MTSAFAHGLAIGLGAPLVLLIVPWMTGDLAARIATTGAYSMMPALALCSIPAGLAGAWAITRHPAPGRALIRLSVGALAGACVVGAVLLWLSYPHVETGRRAVLAITGSPAMLGFWAWLGVIVGAYVRTRRRSGAA